MKSNLYFLLFLFIILSCQSNQENSIEQGSIQIAFSETFMNLNESGRIASQEPYSVVISIASESDEIIIDNQEIKLVETSSGYLLDPVLLEIGNYKLTKFLVLNEFDELIMATPLAGSSLESMVDHALPISFSISSDAVTKKTLQVIYTNSIDPEDLGYTSLSFKVVPTTEILISVFKEDDSNMHYDFIESELTIYGDGDSLYTKALGDSINVVMLRTEFETYKFKAEITGGLSITKTLSKDSLNYYRTTPLDFLFASNSIFSDGIYTLINNNLVKIDNQNGQIKQIFEIVDFPVDKTHSALTFDKKNDIFYLIQNTTASPKLVSIGQNGVYREIGAITLEGAQIEQAEGLAYDNDNQELYMSASLNGGIGSSDFYSESLLKIDVETAISTFVTTIITYEVTQPESDTDDMVVEDGTLYLVDAAPPGANFVKVFSLPISNINIGGSTEPTLNFQTIYYSGARIAINDEMVFMTSDRNLYQLDFTTPNVLFVGKTHDESEFEGATIRGVTYVE